MNLGILLVMILTKVVRGPGGGNESIFGTEICDTISWVSLFFLIVVATLITLLASKIANKEYTEKKNMAGYKFVKGD